ncbi:glycosyltransferase family 2 protein [Phenylobacterium immobile]|uniref:glycosyltransferase family 2 protein n=1 Tax=Phenylobacterium immobile TaxID=21 RepID=UPI000AAF76F5|nr:glycosyltransferase family 2 protein [Phenylobacterium immobile]
MKIAAHIGVKDEVELIDRTIDQLYSLGVEEILICDLFSTDGTEKILENRRSDAFKIIKIANDELHDVALAMDLSAVKALDADWVVFIDADELLIARDGDLKGALARADADLITVPRYNVPLGPEGALMPADLSPEHHAQIQLIVEPPGGDMRLHLRNNPETAWIRAVPSAKVIARQHCIGGLRDGMHQIVVAAGQTPRRRVSDELLIAHLPLTTFERFKRKVTVNIRECFDADEQLEFTDPEEEPTRAWHWRRWLALAERGELEQEFRRSQFSADELAALQRNGTVRSAADLFSRPRT